MTKKILLNIPDEEFNEFNKIAERNMSATIRRAMLLYAHQVTLERAGCAIIARESTGKEHKMHITPRRMVPIVYKKRP